MASLWDWAGAGLNLAGGIAGWDASRRAGRAQRDAAENAAAGFRPYAELGDQAAGMLQEQLSPNALLRDFSREDFTKDPGFKFRRNEGEKAIDRAAGARGSRYSGATLKGLQRYAQDFASNEYQNAYNRFNNDRTMRHNFLSGAAQLGVGAQGQVGNYTAGAGAAQAAGQMGGANALWGGVADAYNGVTSRDQNNQFMTWLQTQYGRRP